MPRHHVSRKRLHYLSASRYMHQIPVQPDKLYQPTYLLLLGYVNFRLTPHPPNKKLKTCAPFKLRSPKQ